MTAPKKKRPAKKKVSRKKVLLPIAGQYPNNMNGALTDAKVSKGELGRRLDLDRPYVSRMASGYSIPSVVVAIAVARELKTTVEEIWGDLQLVDCRRR